MVGTGAMLAMNGRRVAMLDFDLDASGLATIFNADRAKVAEHELLNILKRLEPARIHDSLIEVTDMMVTRFGVPPKGKGCLKYIPTISNPTLSDEINWKGQGLKLCVLKILQTVLEDCEMDTVLVDLDPGFSPSAAVLFRAVDRAVVVTRLDRQNIEGLRVTVPQMVKKNLNPLLAVNMVPPESPKTNERIKMLEDATGQPVSICIDYDPELVFDDDLESISRKNSPMNRGVTALAGLIESAGRP